MDVLERLLERDDDQAESGLIADIAAFHRVPGIGGLFAGVPGGMNTENDLR
jgi:hypothetical protein